MMKKRLTKSLFWLAGAGLLLFAVIVALWLVGEDGLSADALRNAELAPTIADSSGVAINSAFKLEVENRLRAADIQVITQTDPQLEMGFHQGANKKTVLLAPAAPLAPATVYRFNLTAQGEIFSYAFETQSDFNVVSVAPAAANVDTNSPVVICLNKSNYIDPAPYWKITPAVEGEFALNGRALLFIPTEEFAAETTYTVTLAAEYPYLDSKQTLGSDYSFSFTTAAKGWQEEPVTVVEKPIIDVKPVSYQPMEDETVFVVIGDTDKIALLEDLADLAQSKKQYNCSQVLGSLYASRFLSEYDKNFEFLRRAYFDVSGYQTESGGCSYIPGGEDYPLLALLVAILDTAQFNKTRLHDYFVRLACSEDSLERAYALCALASFGDPVLNEIKSTFAYGKPDVTQRLALILGLHLLGDEIGAAEKYEQLANDYQIALQQDRVDEEGLNHFELKSSNPLALIVAATIAKPEVYLEALAQGAQAAPLVRYLADTACLKRLVGKGAGSYLLDDQRTEFVLTDNKEICLLLPTKRIKDFDLDARRSKLDHFLLFR